MIMIFCFSGNGFQPKFNVHIFSYGLNAEANSLICKHLMHHSVSRTSTGFVVKLFNFLKTGRFTFVVGALAILPIVVVGIWMNTEFIQKPVHSKSFVDLVDEMVFVYLLSFAKNAAAFFKKSFSFRSSATSALRRLSSSISASCFA